ncbi:MAG TPA: hypothetical protein VI306_07045 [Pyrinomonadaceae bacterium]
MKKYSIIACLALLLFAVPVLAQTKKRERTISVATVQGRTIGFQMGDYQHVDVRRTNGRRKSFFVFKGGLDYFLALHKNELVTYTYEVADVNLPENGGLTRVERLVSAQVGKEKFETWWKRVSARNSVDELDKKYGPMVSKYELKN